MEQSKNPSKKMKRGKISNFTFTQFMIVFFAGGVFSIGISLQESLKELSIALMLIASGLFAWYIVRQARSSISTEERIDKLEERIKKLEQL